MAEFSPTGTCNFCKAQYRLPIKSSEFIRDDTGMRLVYHLDTADLELHMLQHQMCTCSWEDIHADSCGVVERLLIAADPECVVHKVVTS